MKGYKEGYKWDLEALENDYTSYIEAMQYKYSSGHDKGYNNNDLPCVRELVSAVETVNSVNDSS